MRISGVDLPHNKRIVIALTYLHGIGASLATKILHETKIPLATRTKDLTDQQANALLMAVKKYRIEGDVRRHVQMNIKRLKEIGSYRGIRHRLGLPVRGQITQKNARTRKGPRKTVANKKKIESKT